MMEYANLIDSELQPTPGTYDVFAQLHNSLGWGPLSEPMALKTYDK